MLWAAATTNLFSFCRSGKITVPSENSYNADSHLSFEDLQADHPSDPSSISLRIKHSTVIPGRKDDDLCPVAVLLNYLTLRGNSPGPLFRWEHGAPLAKSNFVVEVRSALTAANLPGHQFAGHSFRRGAATTAAMAGIQDSTIQTLRRWKSTTYLLYIKLQVSSSLFHPVKLWNIASNQVSYHRLFYIYIYIYFFFSATCHAIFSCQVSF